VGTFTYAIAFPRHILSLRWVFHSGRWCFTSFVLNIQFGKRVT
jgi:hypothetical protein